MTDQNTRPTPSSDVAALIEQIDALLHLNRAGSVSHCVPGLAVELLQRSVAALSRLSTPAQAADRLASAAENFAKRFTMNDLAEDDDRQRQAVLDQVRLYRARAASPAQVEVTDEMVLRFIEASRDEEAGYRCWTEAVHGGLIAALTAPDAKPVVPAEPVAGDDGWRPIETAPFREIVDLWCLEKDSPASWDGKTPAGEVIRNRHKSEEYGWFGNQSNDGIPCGKFPDMVPVAWRKATPKPPLGMIKAFLASEGKTDA